AVPRRIPDAMEFADGEHDDHGAAAARAVRVHAALLHRGHRQLGGEGLTSEGMTRTKLRRRKARSFSAVCHAPVAMRCGCEYTFIDEPRMKPTAVMPRSPASSTASVVGADFDSTTAAPSLAALST